MSGRGKQQRCVLAVIFALNKYLCLCIDQEGRQKIGSIMRVDREDSKTKIYGDNLRGCSQTLIQRTAD